MSECLFKNVLLKFEIEGNVSAEEIYNKVINVMHTKGYTKDFKKIEVVYNGISLKIDSANRKQKFVADYEAKLKEINDHKSPIQFPISKENSQESIKQTSECKLENVLLKFEVERTTSVGGIYGKVITEMHAKNFEKSEVIYNGISLIINNTTSKSEFISDYKEKLRKIKDYLSPIQLQKSIGKKVEVQ